MRGPAQIRSNQSFRTFLPKRRKTIRHARKLSTVEAAFSPAICSLRLIGAPQWHGISNAFGVASLVPGVSGQNAASLKR